MVAVDLSREHCWLSLRDDRALLRIELLDRHVLERSCTLQLILADQAELLPSLSAASTFFAALHHPDRRITIDGGRAIKARHLAILQVADALALGARQRDIAIMLIGEDRVANEWRGRSDSLRLAIRRLISAAYAMQAGGWRTLINRTKPLDRTA